jgi:AcrR family transcriptional regulator
LTAVIDGGISTANDATAGDAFPSVPRSIDARRERTRRSLQQAIVELSLDKGFQNLTVENILERAGITRATFYSHFRDKDQLLTSVAEAVVTDVLERFEQMADEFENRRLLALFEDAQREPDRLRVVLRGEGDGIALRYLVERVTALVDEVDPLGAVGSKLDADVSRQLASRAFAGQILAVLSWWMELENPPPPADVVRDLRTLARSGRNPESAAHPPSPIPITTTRTSPSRKALAKGNPDE